MCSVHVHVLHVEAPRARGNITLHAMRMRRLYAWTTNLKTAVHEVSYEENFFFNLIEDISVGDLTVIT